MNTNTTPAARTSNSKLPIHTIRMGRIKAAIWENESGTNSFYNVTFSRTYIGKDQQFHDTDSFSRDDLPLLAKVANDAHSYIFTQLAERKAQDQTP